VLAGYFAARFCHDSGIWPGADYLPFAIVAALIIYTLATREVRILGRVLLSVEGLSVLVMVLVLVVIVVKLTGGFEGRHPSAEVFVLPHGATLQMLVLGSVFGFQAFAGFEGAASLGEETLNPRRNVPRAIALAIGATVVLYLFTSTVMAMGFGVTDEQGKAFADSSGPLFDLSTTYVSPTAALVLELGCMVSAFSAALGTMSGAGRMLFAMSRDALPQSRLARLGERSEPTAAILFVFGFTILLAVAVRIVGIDGLHVAFYFGSVGGLMLLTAYVMANVGAIRMMARAGGRERALIVVSAAGIVMVLYLIFNTLYPVPDWPYNLFPYLVAAWLAVGLAVVLIRPDIAAKVGTGLAAGGTATIPSPDDRASSDTIDSTPNDTTTSEVNN
jgi:amino acid transporter